MKSKLRAPARDPVLAEFDAHDIKEVLAYWELPYAVVPAVAPSEESVSRAFEQCGYAVLYFLKLRRAGNQFNEIGLCRYLLTPSKNISTWLGRCRRFWRPPAWS